MSGQLGPGPLSPEALAPGATIGILGGGQLARMMALAAAPLGLKCLVYAPDGDNPAFDVSAGHVAAPWDDHAALAAFAARCDVVTLEFENIPVATLQALQALVPVRPGPRSLSLTQDRLVEKRFVESLGLPVAPFWPVDSAQDLADALAALGGPGIAKTRTLGYDGRGQIRLAPGDDPAAAFAALGSAPCVLEGLVPFVAETSCLIARAAGGQTRTWPSPANVHREGILRTSSLPGPLNPALQAAADAMAARIATALDHVGVLAVEFFVLDSAGGLRLIVNEIAPRVHNSGHWTLEASATSQFAQHVRAVAGWPLGDTATLHTHVRMDNLVGDDVCSWLSTAEEAGAFLHLYGKRDIRPGRKMGHVTRLVPVAPT